ncbi:MAG: hypothetical protein K5761_02500 [Clostridiales bacterium]|nr:hypothetical protein [Clostridiales bacterium]
MDQIMALLQPIIDTITGLIGGGGEGFDPSAIIAKITELLGGLIGG